MTLGLGYSEIAIILVVALIVIGPRRLPELLRNVGKLMGQLRRASDDLRREILFSDEIRSVQRTIEDAIDPAAPPPIPPRLRTKARAADPGPAAEPEASAPDSSPEARDKEDAADDG